MRLSTVKVPHKKNTANSVPERLPIPKEVTIPVSMHIGRPAEVVVKKGDEVKVGQLIAKASGYVSAPIHSSVSGTVKKIDEITMSVGSKVKAIVIETDSKQELFEGIKPPEARDFLSFTKVIGESGIVGLGGAGFPTFVKLNVTHLDLVDVVIINAAECEPYITSDTRTMLDKTEYIFKGIEAIKKYMGVKRFIIGVEDNKPECVKKLGEFITDGSVEIKTLPSRYPQGGEKVLVYNTIGKMVPKGGLPLDVGAIVINVTTMAFIGEYMETGIPLVEKCVTVDGSAVKEPKNVIAPIGTPLKELFEFSGGFKSEPKKVLYGGPMMGISVPNLDVPVLKMTNAAIAMDEKEAAPPKTTACINCGRCLNHCPLKLDPRAIAKAYALDSGEDLKKLCVDLCMECGCCSYVCPAKRPLVQTNKLAKTVLRNYMKKKEEDKNE